MRTIDDARSRGSNGIAQCAFAAHAHRRRIAVLINVDDGPSVYFRLLRTVDEATQLFGELPFGFYPPQSVPRLGPFASWFPNSQELMATNEVDLFPVTVTLAPCSKAC